MKVQYWSGYVLISLGLIFLISCGKKQPATSNFSDAYQYPIRPGMQEWRGLRTHEDMIRVCQIPEEILKKMSTPGLVETVLNYPLYDEMGVLSSSLEKGLEKGFAVMSSRFNGFQELYKRKDAGSVLFERYCAMDPTFEKNFTSAQKTENVWNFIKIEILLTQDDILATLTKTQREKLHKEAFAKYKIKKSFPDYYRQDTLELTLSLAYKALQQ